MDENGNLEKCPENTQTTEPPPHPKKLKYLTTAAIMLGNITFGCAFNFYSPALEDLRITYKTNVDDISTVFTIQLVCYCLGALSAGFIYRIIHRQLGIIIILAGMAAGLYLTPHCPNKATFFATGGMLGYFVGAYDVSQIVWMIEIWQEAAGPFIQAQHFCYALGSNIPPLLLGPYLRDDDDIEEDPSAETSSRIYIPFTIGGAFSTVACAFHIGLFIFYRYYKPPMYVDQLADENTEKVEKERIFSLKFFTSLKFRLILVTGAFLGAYQGMEMTTMQFTPTYAQYSDLQLSESTSAYFYTGLTAAFAVGRFFGIFIIFKVSPVILLIGNLSLVMIGNFVLLFLANDSRTWLWIGVCTVGLGFSTVYASFSAFLERYLVITDGIGSVMIVCGSAVASIYPIIVGAGIEENVTVLCWPIFFSVMVCAASLSWGWWMVGRKGAARVK